MINNQIEFNKEYSKEVKEIKFEDEYEFEGELLIEDYPNLEKLYFHDIDKIDKITLKNLPQLKDCTIWDCNTKELTINNCPQIKKLNVRKNLLTSLEFLADLESLEELELDGNPKLTEILKPYNGEWKAYRIIELAKQNPQRLLEIISDLREKNKELKKEIEINSSSQPITIDNPNEFKQKYQNLKKTLKSLLEKEQIKTNELILLEEKTKELNLMGQEQNIATSDLFKKIKEDKNNLLKLRKLNKELEEKLTYFDQLYLIKKEKIIQKEKELEELKVIYLEKAKNYEKAEEKLNELLKCQAEIIVNNGEYVKLRKDEIKNKLTKKAKLTIEELDNICQLQTGITQLRLELQRKINQVNQTTNNYYKQGFITEGDNNNLSGASVKDNVMIITRGSNQSITNWQNIHPQFTFELVEKWQDFGFTVEQCQDWINTVGFSQQGQAIQEPFYYAWLRDIKGYTPESLLNHGGEQELRVEFFRLYRNQLQFNFESPKKQETKKNSSQQTKTNEQINQIEKEITLFKEPLNNELTKIIDKFIEANKKMIKNENDKESKKKVKELHQILEEKGISEKDIEKIIIYCERLVDLEWQEEQKISIELPPKAN